MPTASVCPAPKTKGEFYAFEKTREELLNELRRPEKELERLNGTVSGIAHDFN